MSYELLKKAQNCLKHAIERNNASYKNYEELSQVYVNLWVAAPEEEKDEWLNKAFDTAVQAKDRYRGSGRLHFNLAQIADRLEKNDIAIEHYQKAIEIEDQYRKQFRLMYPDIIAMVSRLGEDKYQYSIKQIALLSSQNSN